MKELKVVGADLALYLKIAMNDAMKFTYYTFDIEWQEYWNIFGVHYLSQTPLIVDVRLMYIDQDARDWGSFIAERDAPGYVTIDPDTYPRMITFFERTLGKEVFDHGESITHFSLMGLEELLQFHYPQDIVNAAIGNFYRYIPDAEVQVQDNEKISVIGLPSWSAEYGANQVTSLWFITLSQQQLENPQFDLVDDVDGLGTITFNQQALEELIILLKRRIQPI